MRRLAKGPAIAAAILSILTVAGFVINFVNYLKLPYITALSYVTLALSFLGTVLLIVVLFRGKADTFAAIGCFAQLPATILTIVSSVSSVITVSQIMRQYPLARSHFAGNIVAVVAALLTAAAFVLMALQCLRKSAGKNAICIILPIAAAVLSTAQIILVLPSSTGFTIGELFDRPSAYMIGAFVGAVLGAVIGALPLLFTGMAFGKLKTGEEAPAQQPQVPLYMQYQQPQHQAPQYQQPQYQVPQYQQPQYQAPQYQQPQYQVPQYQVPQYRPAQAPQPHDPSQQ